MKKIQYSRYGGPEELRLDDVPLPDPGKGEVRVAVGAASVNPMDGKIRRGEMKFLSGFRFPRGLGHDFAGVVDAVGPGVTRFKPGDAVIGLTSIPKAGAMADYVLAEVKNMWAKPEGVPFAEAAALTLVGITAWNALILEGRLAAGQTVFINGCVGAVGRSAVQIAVHAGARVAGSCSAGDLAEAGALGVEAVDYLALDVDAFAGRFDLVFDTAGALSLKQCGVLLKPGGVSLHIVPDFGKWLGSLVSRRHRLVFGTPSRDAFEGIARAATLGVLVPAIARTVPLSQAIPALAELERNGPPKGKLVFVAG